MHLSEDWTLRLLEAPPVFLGVPSVTNEQVIETGVLEDLQPLQRQSDDLDCLGAANG